MGLGSAVDRDLSRKHLYGHKPNRCGRGFHCACAPVGAVANSDTLDVVATLVYPAGSYRVLKSFEFWLVGACGLTTHYSASWAGFAFPLSVSYDRHRDSVRRAGAAGAPCGGFLMGRLARILHLDATINRELAIVRRGFRLGAQEDPPLVQRQPHPGPRGHGDQRPPLRGPSSTATISWTWETWGTPGSGWTSTRGTGSGNGRRS
jgi:hypothetical protein